MLLKSLTKLKAKRVKKPEISDNKEYLDLGMNHHAFFYPNRLNHVNYSFYLAKPQHGGNPQKMDEYKLIHGYETYGVTIDGTEIFLGADYDSSD